MSFLRPHTVTIYRDSSTETVGLGGYGAALRSEEVKVLGPVAANIAEARQARPVTAGLPSRTMFRGIFEIVFNGEDGVVRTKDIAVDQNGNRYQVLSVGWGKLGYSILGELMEI